MKLENMTFRELVDEATREVHSKLLEYGHDGMRRAIFTYMETAIRWNLAQQDKKNAQQHKG